jgi:hypothetical protein
MPSLNHPVRIKNLEAIAKENLALYNKLQNIKPTIDSKTTMVERNQQIDQLQRQIRIFGSNGSKRPDPVVRKLITVRNGDFVNRRASKKNSKITDVASH